jgi:hypothetical protein
MVRIPPDVRLKHNKKFWKIVLLKIMKTKTRNSFGTIYRIENYT